MSARHDFIEFTEVKLADDGAVSAIGPIWVRASVVNICIPQEWGTTLALHSGLGQTEILVQEALYDVISRLKGGE